MAYLLISVKRFEDTTDFSKRLKIGKRGEKKWFFNHDKSVGQPIEKKAKANAKAYVQVSVANELLNERVSP